MGLGPERVLRLSQYDYTITYRRIKYLQTQGEIGTGALTFTHKSGNIYRYLILTEIFMYCMIIYIETYAVHNTYVRPLT